MNYPISKVLVVVFKILLGLVGVSSFCAMVLIPTRVQQSDEAHPIVLGTSIQAFPIARKAYPSLLPDSSNPSIDARSVFALDLTTAKPLYQKDPQLSWSPASLTKLMTGIVVASIANLETVVEIKEEDLEGISAPVMNLAVGEKITVGALMKGMLIMSANDAALALARTTAGSKTRFVELMNLMSGALNLSDTHFKNPEGFDEEGQHSTAEDISVIAKEALRYPAIAQIVKTKYAQVSSFDNTATHQLRTSNRLLDDPKVLGVKTGFTDQARGNLVLLVDAPYNHQILTVVLGSESREEESKTLFEWILKSYSFNP